MYTDKMGERLSLTGGVTKWINMFHNFQQPGKKNECTGNQLMMIS